MVATASGEELIHALPSLHHLLAKAHSWCHASRINAVNFGVQALIRRQTLTVTGLGRANVGQQASAKHTIKRLDRLIGNSSLQLEVDLFARLLASRVIRESKSPTILVDWTKLYGDFHVLAAAIPRDGRALMLCWEIHREHNFAKPGVQKRFLQRLARIIPESATPTIVTDAGFHAPWFRSVRELGWNYVGRVRGGVKFTADGQHWEPAKSLYALAQTKAKRVGRFIVSKSNPIEHTLVAVRPRKKPGRKKKKSKVKLPPGIPRRGAQHPGLSRTEQRNLYRSQAAEPWLLATSLTLEPTQIQSIYAQRMQIEETFRHLKSQTMGWRFERTRTKSPKRLRVMMLLAAIAMVLLEELGAVLERAGVNRHYQPNTTTHRRVLSHLRLAEEHLARAGPWRPRRSRLSNPRP